MSFRALCIRTASGLAFAGLVATETVAQQLPETCKPFTSIGAMCHPDTNEPVAAFNDCAIIDMSVIVIDPNTGVAASMHMSERADNVYVYDEQTLDTHMGEAQQRGITPEMLEEMRKGQAALAKAKRDGMCSSPGS